MSPWRDRLVIALAVVVLGTTLVSAQPFGRAGGPGLTVVAGGGGGGVTAGTASANQCAYWTSGSAIAGDADCTFNGTTFAVTTLTVGTGHATPATNDGSQLGTTALMWSDLFLALGSVINFNNGDVTITHSADALDIAGGTVQITRLGLGVAPSATQVLRTAAGTYWWTDGGGNAFIGTGIVNTEDILIRGGALAGSIGFNTTGITAYDPAALIGWPAVAAGARDAQIGRAAAGGFTFADNANGKAVNIKQATELTTIAAAATTDTTIQIPANSLVIAVTVRVTVVIPTAATFDLGVTGATTRYGTGISTAVNTTNSSPGTTNPTIYASAVKITFTPNATPADATGRVRTTVYYIDATAPTS